MDAKIVWLIDENQTELVTYKKQLKGFLKGDIRVDALLPLQNMQDYLDLVLDNECTVAIIIDQKLSDDGKVDYTGIQLAEYLRAVNTKIPIYILTNFVHNEDLFSDAELNVEYVLDKADFIDEDKTDIIAARMLRHINTYEDILSERNIRFRELLKKSLQDELTNKEYEELEQLKYLRLSSTLASELEEAAKLESNIEKNKKLLESLGNESDD